ncbi:hypothetical protein DO72_5910 [Burkholderia pseudomallei]|nr:hypothetical protein DO72_5910 [Burkholderia pseudomallei]
MRPAGGGPRREVAARCRRSMYDRGFPFPMPLTR